MNGKYAGDMAINNFLLTWRSLALFALILGTAVGAMAQSEPKIAALFPAGARAGETVEVIVRGGNLNGAKGVIITGAPGITAELEAANTTVDESAKPIFQAKCTTCHEARSPANRSLTPEQWAATVDRMITARGADIPKPDRDKIVTLLQAQARAGLVTAKLAIAKDAVPGLREVRVTTSKGASTAFQFEVSHLPEVTALEPNSKPDAPQKVTLPVVVNGVMTGDAERDYFAFDIKKGQRVVFNLKSFRLNDQAQFFFNPVLYLYDAQDKEVAKNLGKYGLDPLLDWTAPADGTYTLLVRDLLWRGSPSSVYRLTMGTLPYDVVLAPEGATRPGASVPARMLADMSMPENQSAVPVAVPEGASGVTLVATPFGEAPLLVRDVPDGGGPNPAASPVALPAVFRGHIAQANQVDSFKVKANRGGTYLDFYARRIGSPLRARVVVKNAQGQPVASGEADGINDLRVNNAFPAPGDYTVEVSEADGKSGAAYVYSWEALDGRPDFTLTATPDCLNIPAGARLPILVRATRREFMRGPITVRINNVPAGVTISEAVIPPDDDKAVLLLTASPQSAYESRVVTIEAETPNDGTSPVKLRPRPIEIYKINNNERPYPRNSQVIGIGTDPPPFTLEWKDNVDKLVLQPDKEAKISVKVKRQEGFKGGIYVYFPFMPPGLYIERWLHLPADKDEGEMIVKANGGAQFLLGNRPMPNLPDMTMAAVGIVEGGDGSYVTCTPLLRVVGK